MIVPKIAACMIVKNSEQVIEKALESIRPYVDGIFIYDTGSTDNTRDVLAALAKITHCGKDDEGDLMAAAPITVKQGEWRDDFSWAREQSFAMANDPGEDFTHYLWLDDDDEIVGASNLRHLAANMPEDIHALSFYYDYARDEDGNNVCQLWRERLIWRHADYHWVEPVHECYVPREGQARLSPVPPGVTHWKHHRPATDRYDPSRNLDILHACREKAEAAGEEISPRILAYLGTEYMAKGDFTEAVKWLDLYTKRDDAGWSDERCQVRHKLALCFRAIGNTEAAINCEFTAIRERDTWAENSIGLAACFASIGRWDRAEHWAKQALAIGLPQSPLILNPVEHNLFPWLILTDAYLNRQSYEEAQAAIAKALEVAPIDDVKEKKQEVDVAANTAELVGAALMLREILIRHDENLKAYDLLKSVPYVIEDDPRIVHARSSARLNIIHAVEPDEYTRWYKDVPKESTVGDEHVDQIDQYIERVAYLAEGLAEQETELGRKPEVLDLGCNDFWLECFLWKRYGIHADGVELNKKSFDLGLKRRRKFKAPGKLHHGNLHDAAKITGKKYDAVVLFEVLEHVPDMSATLAVCESMLNPGGRVYLTTPNGAFDRGMIDWERVEPKGHLRALTAGQLADLLLTRGQIDDYRVHCNGRLTFARYKAQPAKSTVNFYLGGQWEPWSPASLKDGGIGGSETAAVQVATRLAARGHRVRVFSSSEEGLAGGVLYRPHTSWDPTETTDLLIVSRLAHVFDNPIGARKTALWCHDHSYPNELTAERAGKIDHIVTLTEWQRARFARLYPWTENRLRVIGNGISYREIDSGEPRYPNAYRPFGERLPRVVFSHSADRGLDVMLDLWPRIRERVPDAELHVFYGFNTMDRLLPFSPNLAAYKGALLEKAKELGGEEGGVFLRGRVGQLELAEEMQLARMEGYPTAFLETFCITALEARAAGLPMLTSDLGALRETVGDHGILLPWGPDEDEPCNQTPEYQDRWVHLACDLLTDETVWNHWHECALLGAELLDWDHKVASWELLVGGATAKARREKVAA
jgi:glycosyltransferase involved in cell wall biosynthesis/2-polyprenyl-3-methyl-5-hydroxy-6-metoxy-1,4-benzoquinol methylase